MKDAGPQPVRARLNVSEKQAIVVLFKDSACREFRGPGMLTGPLDAGTMVVSGFEDDKKTGLMVSLLNPNILGVEITNLPSS